MYKADGSRIRNPAAFVEKMYVYDGGLVDEDGEEIEDPWAFAKALEEGGPFGEPSLETPLPRRPRAAAPVEHREYDSVGSTVMFKADGTPVRNPEAFLSKVANYTGGLFTSDGQEIRNPHSFIAGIARKRSAAAYSSASSSAGRGVERSERAEVDEGETALAVVYKADGTPIKNFRAYLSRIENYSGGLFTSTGEEIRDPHKFLAAQEDAGLVFKADGTPVRNLRAYVSNIIEYRPGDLVTADGQEIRDPWGFLTGLEKANSNAVAFKEDGTPIRNLAAFIAKVHEYTGGLFTADGEEIRNPRRFLDGLERREAAEASQGASPMMLAAPPGLQAPDEEDSRPWRRNGSTMATSRTPPPSSGSLSGVAIYKGDGTRIRNPAAFIAGITSYDGGLFTASGDEIRNPQEFLAGLERRHARRTGASRPPLVLPERRVARSGPY